MAWERVFMYFALNFTGFFIFNEIWKRIKRPPPIDYTTIPGLKSPDLEETEAAITFPPGELIIERSSARGCLDQFQHLITEDFASSDDPILIKVLKYLNGNYGSISSLFIGPRYVVCLSGIKQTKQLRKYWGSNGKNSRIGSCTDFRFFNIHSENTIRIYGILIKLLKVFGYLKLLTSMVYGSPKFTTINKFLANICPWAFGSIILGDPYFWESKSIEEWENEIENNQTLKKFTSFNNQSRLLLDFPETGNETYELYENEHKYEIDDDEKSTVTSPILTLSFQHEIDIDGHLIPAFIPILLNIGILTYVSKHKYLNCPSKMYEFVIDQCIFCDGKFLKG